MLLRIFRRLFFSLLFALLLALAAVVLSLRTTWYLERAGPSVLNRWVAYRYSEQPWAIKGVAIGEKVLSLPENLVLKDVRFVFSQGGVDYNIAFARAEGEGLSVLFGADKIMRLELRGLEVLTPPARLFGANLDFLIHEEGLDYTRGIVTDAVLKAGAYEVSGIKSRIYVYEGQTVLDKLSADFYGGRLTGKVALDYRFVPGYHAQLNLSGVDLKKLEAVNPALFSQVRGTLSGAVTVEGAQDSVRALDVALDATEGGWIKAVLLSPFISYIPPGRTRENMEVLIKSGGYLPFLKGRVEVERVNNRSLRAVVNLRTPELNLADSEVVINLDAEVGEWLRALLQLSQGKRGTL